MTLREELNSELSFLELQRIAKRRGLTQELKSKEEIVNWLLESGITWREYELDYSPHIRLKLKLCKFFGIRRGWKVMDLGCGSGGTSVAAASLVGRKGKVTAIDQSEDEIKRCISYVRKIGFEETVETKSSNVLDLEFENDYFDMVLLLYSPQFLGYREDDSETAAKITN